MKNRRNIIIAFLLCASILVGVGYAQLADVLDVDGTAEYGLEHSFDGNIKFTAAHAYEGGTNADSDGASLVEANEDKVTFTVRSLAGDDDVAYFRFKVENLNNQDVYLYMRNCTLSGRIDYNDGTDSAELGTDIYMVKYLADSTEYATTSALNTVHGIEAGTWHLAETGMGDFDTTTQMLLPQNGATYLYVAVKWENGKPASNISTITATFSFEFGVEDAAATTP